MLTDGQIEVVPVIADGCAGVPGNTVIVWVRAVLVPQLLLAVTDNVPLVVAERDILLPLPVIVPVPLYDQLYVTPATFVTL